MAEYLSLQGGKVYRPATSRLARWMESVRNDFYEKIEKLVDPQRVETGTYLNDIVALWLPSEVNYSISKLSKHGSTALILPGRLFWIDLTIHMDIQCNPGPERLENSQINHLQPSDNSSRNLNNRASNAIKYSRFELLQLRLRQFKIPDETFHLLKSNGIFRT